MTKVTSHDHCGVVVAAAKEKFGPTVRPEKIDELVAAQARLAADIAFSPAGLYQEKFSTETPLHVLIVGPESDAERHQLVEALHLALKDYGARVYLENIPSVSAAE